MSEENKAQVVYFSHGGGPLPLLGDKSHKQMLDFMIDFPSKLKKPDLILVISAHWEEPKATLLGAESPEIFYDYYGFPDKAYEITYPAPGSPDLAERVKDLFESAGISSSVDNDRGFDHGLYIPLKLMYPKADIPCIQLSLLKGLNPEKHINLGKALRALISENILIIGSGFSFHNMGAFDWSGKNKIDSKNDLFQDWLIDVCSGSKNHEEREKLLLNWEKAPNARYCHPREEHLLPLLVCSSIDENPAKLVFDDYILGKRALAFLWK